MRLARTTDNDEKAFVAAQVLLHSGVSNSFVITLAILRSHTRFISKSPSAFVSSIVFTISTNQRALVVVGLAKSRISQRVPSFG